ncbi:hypothetical protein [Flavicella sp.]|uniref:HYC_CC_PP family protein n=1 Tax=Flavicella sp. TaxID=2957742 RepID=UPI0030163FC1
MKRVSNKIASFIMAIVVLFSTMSFTIDMHYCGDTLIDTAIFNKVDTCGMKIQNSSTKEYTTTKNNCCSDIHIMLDGQDELNTSFDSLSKDQQVFITFFVCAYSIILEESHQTLTSYRDYSPPSFIRAIYKLDETYLI